MSCEHWEYRLANGETGAEIDQHLAQCGGCRALSADLRENAVALAAMRDDPLPAARRRWPYVAAALAAAAVLALMLWPRTEAPVAQPIVETIAVQAPELPKPIVNPARHATPKPKPKPAEPLLVKMLTDDPDVVIYWLIDNEGE